MKIEKLEKQRREREEKERKIERHREGGGERKRNIKKKARERGRENPLTPLDS